MKAAHRAAAILLAAVFAWFTWRGVVMFFSGDDMMNMYGAWNINPWHLVRAQFFVWMPVYRPLGTAVYRAFYALFGFHPLPLYVFCWLLLALNAVLSYRFFRELTGAAMASFIAVDLTLVHGNFQDLYLSAGTIYDRLWFLFTVLGIAVYARMRKDGRAISWRGGLLVVLLCMASMDSKESGVALPILLFSYELIFVLPSRAVRDSLRETGPLFAVLAGLSAAFVFARVDRTPELMMTPAYRVHPGFGLWFTRVAEYFGMICYRLIPFSALGAGLLLGAMALTAAFLRNRAMIFGLLLFIVAITPVALIASRPGYVLYVPDLGLGLYFAALLAAGLGTGARLTWAFFALAPIVFWVDVRNWPAPVDPHDSPEYRLTGQFRREYPNSPGKNLLFVTDDFPKPAYDLLFNLRLMYHDRSIVAERMQGPPDQQPNPARPVSYDRVFASFSGDYLELDNRDPKESIRLNILKDYTVGRMMEIARRDHIAYVVSGLMDSDSADPTRWTEPRATFKYDLYPAPATFTAKFWVPDFVSKDAQTSSRTMTVSVNGNPIGSLSLSKDGMNEIVFPVAADRITRNGFTIVDMVVDNPYKDAAGTAFGVVLLRAGFEYGR